jgi:hypothetical protein
MSSVRARSPPPSFSLSLHFGQRGVEGKAKLAISGLVKEFVAVLTAQWLVWQQCKEIQKKKYRYLTIS